MLEILEYLEILWALAMLSESGTYLINYFGILCTVYITVYLFTICRLLQVFEHLLHPTHRSGTLLPTFANTLVQHHY